MATTLGVGTSAPGGEASPARRGLQRGCFQRRYAPRGTCPPLGDFAAPALGCWILPT